MCFVSDRARRRRLPPRRRGWDGLGRWFATITSSAFSSRKTSALEAPRGDHPHDPLQTSTRLRGLRRLCCQATPKPGTTFFVATSR